MNYQNGDRNIMNVFDCIEQQEKIDGTGILDQFSNFHQAIVRDEGREGLKEEGERERDCESFKDRERG